jgi:hypothetical protein
MASFPVHEHLRSGSENDYILDSELRVWMTAHKLPCSSLVQLERYLIEKLNANRVALEYRLGGKTKGWRGVYFGQIAVKTKILDYKHMELISEKNIDS